MTTDRKHPKATDHNARPARDLERTLAAEDAQRSTAEAHFEALRADLLALPPDDVVAPRIDLQLAAMTALGVAARLDDAPLRARFLVLAKTGEYDATCVERLRPAAWAAWYARYRTLTAQGLRSDAQLDDAIRRPATEVRARMMKVARYNLGDDPAAVRRLDQIDEDRGDRDLANDLVALADVYRDHHAVLHGDRFFRATDAADARASSAAIVAHMATVSAGADVATWQDLQNRAWSLLSATYDQVLRGAAFLLWSDARRDEYFPSLVTASRTPPMRARTPDEASPATPTPPNTPASPK